MYCLDVLQVIEPKHTDDECDSEPIQIKDHEDVRSRPASASANTNHVSKPNEVQSGAPPSDEPEPIVTQNTPPTTKTVRKPNQSRKPNTAVQSDPIVRLSTVNSTEKPNHEMKPEKKNPKSIANLSKPHRVERVSAEPRPVDEDIEMKKKWQEEFMHQENRKLMGEKRFRIKKAEKVAPKLQELDDFLKQMRSSWIKN